MRILALRMFTRSGFAGGDPLRTLPRTAGCALLALMLALGPIRPGSALAQNQNGAGAAAPAPVPAAKRKAVLVESAQIPATASSQARRAGLPSCALTRAEGASDPAAAQRFINFMKTAAQPGGAPIITLDPKPAGPPLLLSAACDAQFPDPPLPNDPAPKVPVSSADRDAIAILDTKFCVVLVPCRDQPPKPGMQQINSAGAGHPTDTNSKAIAAEQTLKKRLASCDPMLLQQCPI
jgi:hypothetical protein